MSTAMKQPVLPAPALEREREREGEERKRKRETISQMTASPGSPTISQIEFSVSNRRACCPDLWQLL
jgi:hypothetical protein